METKKHINKEEQISISCCDKSFWLLVASDFLRKNRNLYFLLGAKKSLIWDKFKVLKFS